MSLFTEQEINQHLYEGTSFREVKLILVRGKPDVSKDWFNHESYISERLVRQRAIPPPAGIRRKVVAAQ